MNTKWAGRVFSAVVVLSGFAATSRADMTPKATPITDTRMLVVPSEAKSTEEVVIVLDGYIGDSCQKLLAPVVVKDIVQQTITLTPMTQRIGSSCHEIYLHYRQAVSLGKLPEGNYLVETFDRKFSVPLSITH